MARVLLMDDDVQFSFELAESLAGWNHELEWARSARDAKNILNQQRFDILVSDIYVYGEGGTILPDGGITLISWVRLGNHKPHLKWLNSLPIIAISGSEVPVEQMSVLQLAQDLGASDSLQKPFAHEELDYLINCLLGSSIFAGGEM